MSKLEISTSATRSPELLNRGAAYDSYVEILLKLVPAEVVGAYLAIQGIVGSASPNHPDGTALFVGAALLFIATPFVVWKLRGVTDRKQIAVTTLGFLVWLFATASPLFSYMGEWWHGAQREELSAVLLVLFVFLLPFLFKPGTLWPTS